MSQSHLSVLPAPPQDRSPPHNFEAEQALLGAIFMNNRAIERVSEFLQAHHFADPTHGRIYQACLTLIERNQIANPVKLKTFLANDEGLKELGGDAYLVGLAGAAASIINAEDYGRLVYDLALRRELIGIGEDIVNDAFDPDPNLDAESQIELAEHRLYNLATVGDSQLGYSTFKESLASTLSQIEEGYKSNGRLLGLSTGITELDTCLRGLHKGEVLILAGRPSMGKSALSTNIAYHVAKSLKYDDPAAKHRKPIEGGVVAYFSLEMPKEDLVNRILSDRCNINGQDLRDGNISHQGFLRVVEASTELDSLPLYIDDKPGHTIQAIANRARRISRKHGLHLLIIDYLQIMQGSAATKKQGRVQEISEITRMLKVLAKELSCPVIALSQINRNTENREDQRPHLGDLKDSGSIEQDADVVILIYREQYYLEKSEPQPTPKERDADFGERHERWRSRLQKVEKLAELIIEKQRHGPCKSVTVQFEGEYTRFSDAPAGRML